MSITQQYLLDTYRAQRLGTPAPPAPGSHDWQVVRELRDHRRFRGGPRRAPGPWADTAGPGPVAAPPAAA